MGLRKSKSSTNYQRSNQVALSNKFPNVVTLQFQSALKLHHQGYLAEAEAIYNQILKVQPNHLDTLQHAAILAFQRKHFDNAVLLFDKALTIKSADPSTYSNRGLALHELMRYEEAIVSYDKAIESKPDFAEAHFNRGISLHKLLRYDEALVSYNKAVSVKPDFAAAYSNSGNVLLELQQYDEALKNYDKAITLHPGYADAYYNRGNAYRKLKQFDKAVSNYDSAIAINPGFALLHHNKALSLHQLHRYSEALSSYDKAIELNYIDTQAHYNRGLALYALKRFEEALKSYERAITIKPDFVEVYLNSGNSLLELKRFQDALQSYDMAISLNPDYLEAYHNRGIVLHALKRFEEALKSYERAITIKPDYVEVYLSCGNSLLELKRFQDALQSYDMAIAINPDYAEAYHNRGLALYNLKRYEDALLSYDQALSFDPDGVFWFGERFHIKMQICDWSNFADNAHKLAKKIEGHRTVSYSFPVLALLDSPELQKEAALIHVEQCYPSSDEFQIGTMPPKHNKIRIGYYSPDFSYHPVSLLTAELFECHDRSRFEIYAFSFGPDTKDNMRQRLERAFDKFIDVRNLSDKDVALLSRNLEIDIAIDLAGFTKHCRTGIFAMRAAPVQVSYLGYLGTMSASYIDYLIADETLIPATSQQYYTEKIAYLPSYQVNDAKRRISEKMYTHNELGIPKDAFVFCCFNSNYKITPSTFDGWMRILKQVEKSVLFLYADNELVVTHLKKEVEERGVSRDRLIFGKRLQMSEYLARYRAADLFLDTLPYNAGTTASDALWAGLPVLTCMGHSFAGRVAASLLNAIDLPELITTNQDAYEALAIELATNPEKLKSIKQKLEQNRLTTPLFDTRLFTNHIEAAYTAMYERYHAELPPEHLYIKSSQK